MRLIAILLPLTASLAEPANRPYEPEDRDVFAGQRNLFLKASVTASPHWSDRVPGFAVDGSHGNRGNHWAAENIPVQLTIDLEQPKELSAIRLWTYWDGLRYYQYLIEGSLDGKQWSPIVDDRKNTSKPTGEGKTDRFEPATVRYVRTTFTHNSVSNKSGGHIVEIEGFGPEINNADERAEAKVTPHLAGWVGSTDRRYVRMRKPETEGKTSWSGSAWRGERVNGQLVLWTVSGVKNLQCKTSPLQTEDAAEIETTKIRTRFVRYTLSDLGRKGNRELVADILDTAESLELPAQSARPIWLLIDVPRDAKPGIYRGEVTVTAEAVAPLKFGLSLEVLPRVLPRPSEWSFHLDLWQNPFSVARYYEVEPWSEGHWKYLEPIIRLLANAGQKCITTSIVNRPWGGQTHDAFESMIEWKRGRDGTWSYNFSRFDKWVDFAERCGITKQINCYSMSPWSDRFQYFDETTGKYVSLKAKAGTTQWADHWRPFLKAFVSHLRKTGRLTKTTIAMDERPLATMKKIISFLKEAAPELKVTLAGNYHQELVEMIHDYCIIIRHNFPRAELETRLTKGLPTTFYVCCTPNRPNSFTHSPPAEANWLGWHAAAKSYSGFLRWAYNSWTKDPIYDTRYFRRNWAAGDCFLVYPGPRSSIRFERLREGIQDYEKIRILRKELKDTAEGQEPLAALDKLLSQFTFAIGRRTPCDKLVRQGKKMLLEMSR